MKQITLRNAGDTAPLNPYAGELADGGTLLQSGLLKNTGDVTLSSVRLMVQNEPGLPTTLSATVNGVLLTGTEQEVLGTPLAVGASVTVLITWTAAASILNGEDSGAILGSVS